jgi:hypothetical protein
LPIVSGTSSYVSVIATVAPWPTTTDSAEYAMTGDPVGGVWVALHAAPTGSWMLCEAAVFHVSGPA